MGGSRSRVARTTGGAIDPKFLHNGQGELVHRHTPAGLLYSIATAFDWPAARRFRDGLGFASELVKASGQYISESKQGRKGVDFQGLLFWETQLGRCRKPNTVPVDWIDRLMAAIQTFDADNPATVATVADVAAVVKDWLVGDGKIGNRAFTAAAVAAVAQRECRSRSVLCRLGSTHRSRRFPTWKRKCGNIAAC